jgi:hypothetical protein
MKLLRYSNLFFLQAEEEKGILLPVDHVVAKKQCKGKVKVTVVVML